ncbi:MAG: transposase [Candidatus Diapherotrites archaeon]
MNQKEVLVEKVLRLLGQAQCPRFLHRMGPKTYELWQHCIALLVKQECKLSYRRTSALLNGLNVTVPTYSALCKMSKRIPLYLWKRLLDATHNVRFPRVVALDGVFFTRTNPSFHYLKRIDSPLPVGKPVQANILLDVRSRKCIGVEVHSERVHESVDAEKLLEHAHPRVLVADKAYDSEKLYAYCKTRGMCAHIPIKSTTRKGFYRNYFRKRFDERCYHQRSLVESYFSSLKRCRGSHVASRTARHQRAELYARIITQNLKLVPKTEIFN